MVIKLKNQLISTKTKIFIEGRSVKLVPISENNINDEYLSWLKEPDLNKYLNAWEYKGDFKHQTIEDVYRYINNLRNKERCELFAVFTKKNNVHVGNVGISDYNYNNCGVASFGLLFGSERARKTGLGAEATAIMIEYLFQDARIKKIKLGANEKNESSWRLIENLGFTKERIAKNAITLSSDEIYDAWEYGLIKEKWDSIKQKFSYLLSSMQIKQMI